MNSTPLQLLVRQIFEIAMRLAECDGPTVSVEFISFANHLRVTAKQRRNEPPVIDEYLELYLSDGCPFAKKRIDNRLREIISNMNALLLSNTIPPRPAA